MWVKLSRMLSVPGVLGGLAGCLLWAHHLTGLDRSAVRLEGIVGLTIQTSAVGCMLAVFFVPFFSGASVLVALLGSLCCRPRPEVLARAWLPVILGATGWFLAAYTIGRAWTG